MHISAQKYVRHTVYLLRVSASYVAIFREWITSDRYIEILHIPEDGHMSDRNM